MLVLRGVHGQAPAMPITAEEGRCIKKNKLKGGGGNNPEELSNLQPSQGEQLPREGKVWARRAGDAVNAFLPGNACSLRQLLFPSWEPGSVPKSGPLCQGYFGGDGWS